MLLAMFWFVSLDTTAKYLMQSYSVIQIVWARFFIHVIFVLLFMMMARSVTLKSKRISLQLTRSMLMLAVTGLFFVGISRVQLATASTIMFMSPILVTILAIPLLGEKVGIRRWFGVIVGFVGAIVIVRPGMAGFQFGMLFVLAAAFGHSFYMITTRKVRNYDSPLTSLFYTGAAGAVVTSFIVPFYWTTPQPEHIVLFIFLGFAGSVGHLCLIRAFRVAPASVVAPFSYSSLIWATGYGFLVFSDLPDQWVIIGAILIIGSGLYIFHRESTLKNNPSSQNDKIEVKDDDTGITTRLKHP